MNHFTKVIFFVIALLCLVGTANAASVSIDYIPILYVFDYGLGNAYTANNYTLTSNSDVSGVSWGLLAANDDNDFVVIDTRHSVAFVNGATQQFDVSNPNSFRWYYLFFESGTIGTSFDVHLYTEEGVPMPIPMPVSPPDINFWTQSKINDIQAMVTIGIFMAIVAVVIVVIWNYIKRGE